MADPLRSILASIPAILAFLALFLGFDWSLLVSLAIGTGLYFGVYYLTKPKTRVGNVSIEDFKDSEEVLRLYRKAQDHTKRLGYYAQTGLKDPGVKAGATKIFEIAQGILAYLDDKPQEILPSKHFIDYYMQKTNQVLENFHLVETMGVSDQKFQALKTNTLKSLDLLEPVFNKQRDGYLTDSLTEVDILTDVLEKTLELGGDRNE